MKYTYEYCKQEMSKYKPEDGIAMVIKNDWKLYCGILNHGYYDLINNFKGSIEKRRHFKKIIRKPTLKEIVKPIDDKNASKEEREHHEKVKEIIERRLKWIRRHSQERAS